MDSRESLLNALLSLRRPAREIARDLSACGWDAPSSVIVLDAAPISSMLDRFIAGEVSAAQVEDWASCIECRDDIEYDPPVWRCMSLPTHCSHGHLQGNLQQS
ncbi:hypothetical protein HDE78_002642 [Rhodanobacter sp. K2T2]|uniref:hypothetical protein n=1 Tax=Rhodanobacter sp. K2T2 TaxID=2723085 RepID=UPI0015CE2408|nr:hypothetical protein [Rhodanobacter sp. K2T2]NYE29676.1 hypothetical protein [Rhodanobacter sp. K2T2]